VIDILRNEFTGSNKIVWLLLALLIPALGALLYFFLGRKQRVPGANGTFAPAKTTAIIAAIIVLPIIGFISYATHSAVGQMSEYRLKGDNSAALSDLKNAKTAVEAYAADHDGKYPARLKDADFTVSQNVEVDYRLENPKQYSLFSKHKDGDKVYHSTEEVKFYWRPKSAGPDAWQELL
jgi:hypothetical protein